MFEIFYIIGLWSGIGVGFELHKVHQREVDFSFIGLLCAPFLGPIVILLHLLIIDRW